VNACEATRPIAVRLSCHFPAIVRDDFSRFYSNLKWFFEKQSRLARDVFDL
jgi:hypothetical protein